VDTDSAQCRARPFVHEQQHGVAAILTANRDPLLDAADLRE
jgi:hypothetical protein